jgi:hypothetical protein
MRVISGLVVGQTLYDSTAIRADEMSARSKIIAVGLFKNGLAVVKLDEILGKSGTHVLLGAPHRRLQSQLIEGIACRTQSRRAANGLQWRG